VDDEGVDPECGDEAGQEVDRTPAGGLATSRTVVTVQDDRGCERQALDGVPNERLVGLEDRVVEAGDGVLADDTAERHDDEDLDDVDRFADDSVAGETALREQSLHLGLSLRLVHLPTLAARKRLGGRQRCHGNFPSSVVVVTSCP